MRQLKETISLGLFCSFMAVAASAATFEFTVSRPDDQWECERTGGDDSAEALRLSVEIIGDTSFTEASFRLVKNGQAFQDLSRSDRTFSATVNADDIEPASELQLLGSITTQTGTQQVDCATFRLGDDDTPAPREPRAVNERLLLEDLPALRWWSSPAGQTAFKQLQSDDRFPKRTIFLPHLPSGAAASPFPESVPETSPVQIVVIMSLTNPHPYELERKACADRVPFRIQGNLDDLGALRGAGDDFFLFPLGKPFRCGADEPMIYVVRPLDSRPSADIEQNNETTLRVRPVYRLATTFAYGFDFATNPTFSLDADRVVKRTEDEYGTGMRVGFTWFPWGIDFENMRWYNHFFNPVAVFNPKSPSEDFVLGTAITPTGGLSVLIGASIHKITRLDGIEVGDTLDGEGDIPTITEWSEDGIGWYVGVALDDKIFGVLKNVFKTDDDE